MCAARFGDLRRFETLASTNTYLLDQARLGAPAGVVAVAAYQSAGRGRLGRRWEAPPGTCLLASVLLRPVLDPGQLHLCTAAVALAAADACRDVAGVEPVVKWPNDLLLGERKLAGVLAESDPGAPGGAAGSVAVVVGVGVNVDWPGPAGAGGTCLSEAAGRRVDVDELLGAWLEALGPRADALGSPDGRAALAGELRARCDTLGRRVRVSLAAAASTGERPAGGEVVTGLAVDLVHLRPEGGGSEGRAGGARGTLD